jgi:hypothetical protein
VLLVAIGAIISIPTRTGRPPRSIPRKCWHTLPGSRATSGSRCTPCGSRRRVPIPLPAGRTARDRSRCQSTAPRGCPADGAGRRAGICGVDVPSVWIRVGGCGVLAGAGLSLRLGKTLSRWVFREFRIDGLQQGIFRSLQLFANAMDEVRLWAKRASCVRLRRWSGGE